MHGGNGLKRQYRWHTYKEKLDVVKEVIKGNSINQVSINRNIPIKSIVDWLNLYRQKGISGLKLVNKRKVLMSKKEKEIKNKLKSKDNKSSYTKEEIEYILAEREPVIIQHSK